MLCHCEHSEAICWINESVFKHHFSKQTDCFTAIAMTAFIFLEHIPNTDGTEDSFIIRSF
jgi:hypothetical protein